MHDGAPAKKVTDYLNRNFPNRWIGFNSPLVRWPARSPDLTPCDFSIWGRLKTLVYREEINNREHLKERIEAAFAAIKADEDTLEETIKNVLKRAEYCFDNHGGHFENYL